jgi:predicted Zn-dependent protease
LTAKIFLLPVCALVAGCMSTASGSGRTQVLAPQEIGIAYSETELQGRLLFTAEHYCDGRDCEDAALFRREIRSLSGRLAKAARELAPELELPLARFHVSVAPKSEFGTLSSAAGSVVIFGGLRNVGFEEPALAFLVAREMGHVLSRHHEENSAANVIMSVAAALLFPVGNLLRGAAAILPTSGGATAATTMASMAGSSILKGMYRSDQLREADHLALQLMIQAGWTPFQVADALHAAAPRLKDEGWMGELLLSKERLDQLTMGPPWLMPSTMADASARSAAALAIE